MLNQLPLDHDSYGSHCGAALHPQIIKGLTSQEPAWVTYEGIWLQGYLPSFNCVTQGCKFQTPAPIV